MINCIARRHFTGLSLALSCLILVLGQPAAHAQQQPAGQTHSTIAVPTRGASNAGLGRTNLQCAGYFRLPPLKGTPEIVGGEQEQEKNDYATGDYVYIDSGSRQGVREGQEFHIIRPRGQIKHVFRQKKGNLGVFVQEVGQLRVVDVKEDVSMAQIVFSCDSVFLGDLLTGVPDRGSPDLKMGTIVDRFASPTGKPTGRILMSKDGHETAAVGDVIYIDIGDEDKAVPGDYVTIYRKAGTGNLNVKTYELLPGSEAGFASEHYRGSGLSLEAQRAKARVGEEGLYMGDPIRTADIKHKRQRMPRKIVGEAIIFNVQVRTATALITSVAQEVHTGDFVELR